MVNLLMYSQTLKAFLRDGVDRTLPVLFKHCDNVQQPSDQLVIYFPWPQASLCNPLENSKCLCEKGEQ